MWPRARPTQLRQEYRSRLGETCKAEARETASKHVRCRPASASAPLDASAQPRSPRLSPSATSSPVPPLRRCELLECRPHRLEPERMMGEARYMSIKARDQGPAELGDFGGAVTHRGLITSASYKWAGTYSHGWALRKLELWGDAPFLRVS